MDKLLKQAHRYNKEINECLDKVYGNCQTYRIFNSTPPRPEFNTMLTLDLKEIKVNNFKYIMHMIDAFTCLTCSVFIRNKEPETILHMLMKNWVPVGYGVPKKCSITISSGSWGRP